MAGAEEGLVRSGRVCVGGETIGGFEVIIHFCDGECVELAYGGGKADSLGR